MKISSIIPHRVVYLKETVKVENSLWLCLQVIKVIIEGASLEVST